MRAAIVLAAGRSLRFGRGDKLLALLRGRPLLLHAIDRAREAGAARVLVVTSGARVGRLVRRQRGIVPVRARGAGRGLSVSLAAGLAALRPVEREVMVFLGDMPFARAPRALRLTGGIAAARPVRRGAPGHPLLVRTAAARMAEPRGDSGLGGLTSLATVRGSAANVYDIDSRATLRMARLGSRHRATR